MLKIAVLASKGGVHKSSLSRSLGLRLAQRGFSPVGVDLDLEQASFAKWMQRRVNNGYAPTFPVVGDANVSWVRTRLDKTDASAAVIDGAAYASRDTLAIADLVDCVVIPTGYSIDDLEAAIKLGKALIADGVPNRNIIIAFWSVLESKAQHKKCHDYLRGHSFNVTADYVPLKTSYADAMAFGQALQEVNAPRLRTTARVFLDSLIDFATGEKTNGKT